MTRGDDLAKDMSRYLIDQIERHPRVTVLTRSEVREVREVHGDGELRSVVVENNKTGERQEIEAPVRLHRCGTQHRVAAGHDPARREGLRADRPRGDVHQRRRVTGGDLRANR